LEIQEAVQGNWLDMDNPTLPTAKKRREHNGIKQQTKAKLIYQSSKRINNPSN
jgi:hypothetical protein